MKFKLKNDIKQATDQVAEEIYNWVVDCMDSVPMPLKETRVGLGVLCIPLYVQRQISNFIYRNTGQILGPAITELHGWKIIPGYEEAIVFFVPECCEMKEMVVKFPFNTAQKWEFIQEQESPITNH